ncbi:DUF3300 domain-containing protein [Pseudoxanthomonas sp. 10H]|uniref:DUF3300 domain-containing protein n=1 Tax=Pseudoxanthomonas sp. 10H TaxID=3242729 RepID=UPI0035592E2C
MRIPAPQLLAAAVVLAVAGGSIPGTVRAAPQSASSSAKPASSSTFSTEQLDQMMAPIALYPDSLLAQVLMASTYPGDVADAVKWSAAHKDAKGEAAVKQVADQPWDPSVQSLVAFPQLLAVLGQDPAWVQKMGDAFLAQPDAVMASVQRLRRQAEEAGNLKSNEQQKVSTQAASTQGAQPATQTIVIESADPEVVYVPSYNPSVVYGSWAYPSYPPYYYPPPPYYYPGGALLSFGIGVAVGGALWGDLDWGHGDIDIDINRYNEINSNRQIDRSSNKWNHNAANRDGVPYRDNASRERYGRQTEGAAQRDAYRGRDPSQARTADRERARQSMERSGIQPPAASNQEARQRASQASRDMGPEQRARSQGQGAQRPSTSNTRAQQEARQRSTSSAGRQATQNSSAFSGAGNPSHSRAASSRGHNSYSASQRPAGARSGGAPVHRSAPPRGGGGGRRR